MISLTKKHEPVEIRTILGQNVPIGKVAVSLTDNTSCACLVHANLKTAKVISEFDNNFELFFPKSEEGLAVVNKDKALFVYCGKIFELVHIEKIMKIGSEWYERRLKSK